MTETQKHTPGAYRAADDIMHRSCPELPQTAAMREILASTIDRETAAPDLLKAAERAELLFDVTGDPMPCRSAHQRTERRAAVHALRAAIARATT